MIIFKRGDTFQFTGTAAAVVNGVRTSDFTGWTARAQVRTKGGRLVQELQVSFLDAATGKIAVLQTGPTTAWPLEVLEMDIRFTDADGSLISTDVMQIKVVVGVTQ